MLQVTHVCLVLVCSDFNPHLYSCLSQMLLCRFVETSSPVTVLEVFLELLTHGQCHSVNNGTVTALDFDANHWALSQSTVTGRFTIHWPLFTFDKINQCACCAVLALTLSLSLTLPFVT